MGQHHAKVHRQGEEVVVEVIDDNGTSFCSKVRLRTSDVEDALYAGELRVVTVDGPMKIDGQCVPSIEVAFTPVDEIQIEPSADLKYLRLRAADLVIRQSVFFETAEGRRVELTLDSLPVEP